jgi:hypothetical protein
MGQPRPPEVLLQQGIHGAGVADDQPWQQPGRAGVEHARRGCREPAPDGTGRTLHGPRSAEELRRTPRRHHGHHVVPSAWLGGQHPRPDVLTRQQIRPLLRRGEEQHRGVHVPNVPAVQQLQDGGVGDHPRPAGSADRARVGIHLQDDVDRPTGVGHGRQRRVTVRRSAYRTGGRRHRHAGQQHQGDRGGPVPPPGDDQRQAGRNHRDRGELPGREERCQGADDPDGGRGGRQTQIHPHPAEIGPLTGPAGHGDHTDTSSRSSAALDGPMPGTSSSCSTERNGP